MTKEEKKSRNIKKPLKEVLEEFRKTDGVESPAISCEEGIIIARSSQLDLGTEMATIFDAAKKVTVDIEGNLPEIIIIESKKKRIIVANAAPKTLLSLVTNMKTDLFPIILQVKKTAREINKIVKTEEDIEIAKSQI